MKSSIARRIEKMEREARLDGQDCTFCEQYYWTLISTNRAEGPYSKTARGNEAGLAIADALKKGLVFEEVHEGVVEAFMAVEETHPLNPQCPRGCNEWWPYIVNVEAGVLLDYPEVAEVFIECLKEYAKRPLEARCHYWMCPDIRKREGRGRS
jgi:hypothetical protein